MNVLFARTFSADVSGMVFYWFTVFAVIIQFASLSLESGVWFAAARKLYEDKKLLGLSIAWSLGLGTLAVVLIKPVSEVFHLKVGYPLYFPFCFIAGNMLIAFGNAFCYSKGDFFGAGIAALSVNVLLIVTLPHDPENFIAIYFLSFPVQALVLFLYIFWRFRILPSFVFQLDKLKIIFSYSLKAFAGNVLFLLINRVDYFFVKNYCSAEDLGNYIQASKIAQLFFILPSMVATVIFSVAAGGVKTAAVDRVRTISVMILMGYSVVLILLALTGKWLFPWMYGKSFETLYLPFVLLIPGILAISSLYPYTSYYSAIDKIRVNVEGAALALILIVIADWIFIPVYGITAAALVSSIGYIVFQFYVMLIFKKEFDLPFKKLFTLNRNEYSLIIQSLKG